MNEDIHPRPAGPDVDDVVRCLRALRDAAGTRLAVCARDERTGETVRLDGDAELQTASVIKLAVLVAVHARARDGALALEDRVRLTASDAVGGSGVVKELSPGTALTVRDLATLMIVVSDNLATNLCIDAVGGVEIVNRVVHDELGLRAITLRRKLTFSDPGRGPLGLASPDALVALLGGLVAGTVVSAAASADMLATLARQQYLDQVPRLLDRRELVEEPGGAGSVAIACKTGMIDGVRADAGILRLGGGGGGGGDDDDHGDGDGRTLTYAVMSESSGDAGLDADADAALVNAEAGRLIVEWGWGFARAGDAAPVAIGDQPPLVRHPAARWEALRRAAGGR